jgi:nitrite reductase (NADH) small subunit/3-phenylpropionate/trans-cinnamate dioxygenase ferredoxin subunit
MDNFHPLAAVDSLADGACRSFEVRGLRLMLVRLGAEFHVVDAACPHRGAPLGSGFLQGREVFCPLHGWSFDVTSGACLTRPDKPLRRYVTVLRDGQVWVSLIPSESAAGPV